MPEEYLPPYPPTSGWCTVRDVLHEIFADVHRGWVQDFLLHFSAVAELQILTNPGLHSRTIPATFRACVDPGMSPSSAGTESLAVSLYALSYNVDELIAGISVESVAPVGDSKNFFPISDYVNRFVLNRRTGSNFELTLEKKLKIAQIMWFTNNRGRKLQAILHFNLLKFESCFQLGTGKYGIDFQLLEQALVSSVVGEIDTSQPSITTLPGILGNTLQNDYLCLELRRFFIFGDYYSQNVGTAYLNGQPKRRSPFFLYSSRVDGTSTAAMEKLSQWAITDRICNIQPIIKVAPPLRQQVLSEGTLEFDNGVEWSTEQVSIENTRRVVEIAPNPTRKEYGRVLSFAEKMDAQNREKILQRKIKNRQAAARSYARKRAETR